MTTTSSLTARRNVRTAKAAYPRVGRRDRLRVEGRPMPDVRPDERRWTTTPPTGTAGALQTIAAQSDLAIAAQHVAQARRIVTAQHARIARLRHAGCSTLDAEQTLGVFQ